MRQEQDLQKLLEAFEAARFINDSVALPDELFNAKYFGKGSCCDRVGKFAAASDLLLAFVLDTIDAQSKAPAEYPPVTIEELSKPVQITPPARTKRKYTKRKTKTTPPKTTQPKTTKTRKESSQFRGVCRKKKNGKWLAQLNRGGVYWFGGYHDNELSAAAMVQDQIGNAGKAKGLRAMAEAGKGIDDLQWMCEACGYDVIGRRPEKCPKCNNSQFDFLLR